MADKKVIAVLGATGAQGGGVVRAIFADESREFTVRALTRKVDSDKAKAMADSGAEVVAADLDDYESLKKAFTGEKLKTAPRDYPKDHPEIELLKFKSYLAVHNVRNNEVLSDNYLQHATKVFKALHPFDKFLNDAI